MMDIEKDVIELEEIALLFDLQDKKLNAQFIRKIKNIIFCIKTNLDAGKLAKIEHKKGNQCSVSGCTACHFWSGTISALSELVGDYGVIE